MIIISWDVGIIHLAYCVLQYFEEKNKIKILDWDEINLIEDDRIKLTCCGELKAKKGCEPDICGKNASYYLTTPNDPKAIGFCKTHLDQHNNYWSLAKTKKLFKEKTGHICTYSKKNGDLCGIKSKYQYGNDSYFCTAHYKVALKKKIKENSPQPIKNLIVKKYPTADLQLTLVKKLDLLAKHFAKLKIEEVIIENQPSMKNPKMKAIASTLFDYFMIRGFVDKIHNMDIKLVRFMCPNNKLRVNEKNTIEVFKANKGKKGKYKLTKELSVKYTKQLLNHDTLQLDYLDLHKKQDDICDAYLQGRYYLQFIKNKPKSIKKSGSKKSSKKSKKNDKVISI